MRYIILLLAPAIAMANLKEDHFQMYTGDSHLEEMEGPYTSTLPCASCIDSGYVFCRLGRNADEFTTDLPGN